MMDDFLWSKILFSRMHSCAWARQTEAIRARSSGDKSGDDISVYLRWQIIGSWRFIRLICNFKYFHIKAVPVRKCVEGPGSALEVCASHFHGLWGCSRLCSSQVGVQGSDIEEDTCHLKVDVLNLVDRAGVNVVPRELEWVWLLSSGTPFLDPGG